VLTALAVAAQHPSSPPVGSATMRTSDSAQTLPRTSAVIPSAGVASAGRYSVPLSTAAGLNGPWPPRSEARGSPAPGPSWRLPCPVQAGGAAPGSAHPCASAVAAFG